MANTWVDYYRRIGAITKEDHVLVMNDRYVAAICKQGSKHRVRIFNRSEMEFTRRCEDMADAQRQASVIVRRGRV